ncbi:type II secretion system protein [Nostoc sp. FACHB-190]|nr:type II secretion system protein [Nostoc sp. FACHB-190]
MHLFYRGKLKNILYVDSCSGFTLPEILVIVLMFGILAGLLLPNWLAFVDRSRLNTAQDKVYLAMRQAQSQALKEKVSWQVSFREENNVVKWAVHRADANFFISDAVNNNANLWQNLETNILIDKSLNNRNTSETTVPKHTSQAIWRVVFNHQGCPVYQPGDECTNTSLRTLGQITLYSYKNGKARRCVYVSTILGAMRKGRERSSANENDKYCY